MVTTLIQKCLKLDSEVTLENWKSSVFDMDVIVSEDECANAESCLLECSELMSRWSTFVNYAPEDFSSNLKSLKEYVDKVIFLCPTDSFVTEYETKEKNKFQAGQAKVGDSAFAVVPMNSSKSSNSKGKAKGRLVNDARKKEVVLLKKMKAYVGAVQKVYTSPDENNVISSKFPPFATLSPEEEKQVDDYSKAISNIYSNHMSAHNPAATAIMLMSTGDSDVPSDVLAREISKPMITVNKPDPVHKLLNDTLDKIYKSSTSSSSSSSNA